MKYLITHLLRRVWVENATPEIEAQSQYPEIIAVCSVLTILSTCVLCARLIARQRAPGLAADDFMAALAVVFAIVYSGLCVARELFALPIINVSICLTMEDKKANTV